MSSCGANAGVLRLALIVVRDDVRPGQAITSVTDATSGALWTPLGQIPWTNGLLLGAYGHLQPARETNGVRVSFALAEDNRAHFSASIYTVVNASGFDTPASVSAQPSGGSTLSQPDFSAALANELVISMAGYTSATTPTFLSNPTGTNPSFFTIEQGADLFSAAVLPSFYTFGGISAGPGAIGARQIGADHPVQRAGVMVFGIKPAGPPPDFGEAFPWARGAQPFAAMSRDPVNLGTGAFTLHAGDLTLPGRVLPVSFTRWYNSADPTSGPLGPGWTHTYNWTIGESANSADVRNGDGRIDTYSRNADGSYTPPPSVFATLVKNADSSFVLTRNDQVRYEFSSNGRLTRIAEPAGNAVTLGYTGSDLTTITDTVGRVLTLSYDAQHRLTALSDPAGRSTTYAYDASGRLVTVTGRIGNAAGGNPALHQWRYGYDGASRHITTVTDPDGRVRVTNTYDAQGRVASQRDGQGALSTFAYSAGQTVVTDPRGHSTTYTLDGRLRGLAQRDVVDGSTLTLSYTYDAAGNRSSVTDRNGRMTDFTYDPRGNVLTKTDPSPDGVAPRPVTAFAYDARNNLTQITDAAGAVTTLAYDPVTNVLLAVSRQIDAASTAVTKYEYADPANPGLPTRIIAPRGNTTPTPDYTFATALAYDAQGNLVSRTDPDGARTTFAYDAAGRLASFVDPDGNAAGANPAEHTWTIAYDPLDRETSRTDPLGNTIAYAYDGAGNRTSLTDRSGNVTSYAYDANTRLTSVQQRPDPVGQPALVYTTTVARDANGNAVRITQANGAVTDYAFDALDRLLSVTTYPTPQAPLVTSYTLDPSGQPLARTTGDGVTVSYAYDALARLVSVSAPGLPPISYQYDPLGRRSQMRDGTGVTSYTYDGLGRRTQTAAPAGTLGYAYDPDGNRTALTYPSGDTVRYAYSPGGRLLSVTDWAGRVSTYSYQPSGLVSSLAYPNGMSATYAYDRAQRLTALTYTLGTVIASERYTLDNEGNRTTLTDLFGASPVVSGTLGYDGLERLTRFDRQVAANGFPLSNESFGFDAASNVTTRSGPSATFSYDGANRLTADGSRAFVWDGADRLVQRGTDTFSYDPFSRLTSSSVSSAARSYTYDGDGLLRSRGEGSVTAAFLYDPSLAPAPLLAAGAERIVYGLGPLYRVHANASFDTLVRDGLGSVRLEVSGTGRVTNAYDYTAYGALQAATGLPLLGFAGELHDPSGLIYLRARWYDPAVGRFITRDSLAGITAAPFSLNLYVYAGDNPVNYSDPSGHCAPPLILVCVVAARAVIGGVVGGLAYTGGVVAVNLAHAAAGEKRGLFEGFSTADLAISVAAGAFGGAIGVPALGFDKVEQFYLNTLVGYVGSMASITARPDKDPARDWITVVMGTAFAGYGAVVFPEGIRSAPFAFLLAAAQQGYEGFLGASPSSPVDGTLSPASGK